MVSMALKKRKERPPKKNQPKNDIEKARLAKRIKSKKERRKKWIIGLAVVVSLFLVRDYFNILNLPHWVRIGYNSVFHRKSYPLQTNKGVNEQIKNIGSESFVLTDTSFFIVNGAGYYIQDGTHNINHPVAQTNGKRFLIYGKNEKSVVTGDLFYNNTYRYEDKIAYAAVASNGYYALVTESERYFNEVVVYNTKGQEIYRWFSANQYVVNVQFTSGSGGLIVNCAKSNDGKLDSIIYTLDFNKEKEVTTTQINDFLAIDYFEKNGTVTVIGDTKALQINKSGEIKKEYSYEGKKLIAYNVYSLEVTLVMATGQNSYYHEIKVLDSSLIEKTSFSYENGVKYVARKGNKLFLLNDRLLTQLDLQGKVVKETNLQNNTNGLISDGNYTMTMSKAVLERIKNK